MDKRTLCVWIFVLLCIITGILSTRKGEEIKATYQREYADLEKSMLDNAAQDGTFGPTEKHLFLAYLGFPNIQGDPKIQLRPVNPNKLDYQINIVVNGNVVGKTDRQTLEGYFVGRERPVQND